VAEALSVSPDVPVIQCDARQRKSVKKALMTLVQHAMGARLGS
jgi:signal recognition particle receptor subunit beta